RPRAERDNHINGEQVLLLEAGLHHSWADFSRPSDGRTGIVRPAYRVYLAIRVADDCLHSSTELECGRSPNVRPRPRKPANGRVKDEPHHAATDLRNGADVLALLRHPGRRVAHLRPVD